MYSGRAKKKTDTQWPRSAKDVCLVFISTSRNLEVICNTLSDQQALLNLTCWPFKLCEFSVAQCDNTAVYIGSISEKHS